MEHDDLFFLIFIIRHTILRMLYVLHLYIQMWLLPVPLYAKIAGSEECWPSLEFHPKAELV